MDFLICTVTDICQGTKQTPCEYIIYGAREREADVCVHTPHHILLIMHSMSEVSAPVIFLQFVHDVMRVGGAVNINL